MRSIFVCALVFAVAACSSAGGVDDGAPGGEAATIGTRLSSPLKAGRYDADSATLNLYDWVDRQEATIAVDGIANVCSSNSVDVTAGKVTVKSSGCALTLTPSGNSIQVKGTVGGAAVDAMFARRRNVELDRSFVADPAVYGPGTGLTISAADDAHVTLDLTFHGVEMLTGEVATNKADLLGEDSLSFLSDKCKTSVFIWRHAAKFVISASGDCDGDHFSAVFHEG